MLRSRLIRAFLLLLFVAVCVGSVSTLAFGVNNASLHVFAVVPRPAYVSAPDPISNAENGWEPQATLAYTGEPSPAIRAIVIHPARVDLVVAGKTVKIARQTVTTLPQLVRIVNNPAWLQMTGGIVQVNVAVIIEANATLNITAPQVTTVRLLDAPGVMLGTRTGELLIQGVTVINWKNGHAQHYSAGAPHPSIVASREATMSIRQSHIVGLGWDWNASYGVSWMAGSHGGAWSSSFEYGFIGAYTDHVQWLTFDHSTFSHNALYGLDPHSTSSNLTVTYATAQFNRGNGIIFSNHVTNSVISDSNASFNGENGIMMDAGSSGNRIERNTVMGNQGDGIVAAQSPGNTLVANRIASNRVGIHLTGATGGNRFANNTLYQNAVTEQGVPGGLPQDNQQFENGGQFVPAAIQVVWIVTGSALLLLLLITALLRRRNRRRMVRA